MLVPFERVGRDRFRAGVCVVAAVVCVLASACGTVATRTTQASRQQGFYPDAQGDFFGPDFYSAVAFDVLVATDTIESGLAKENGCATMACSPCSAGPMLVWPFVVLFDLALDTVLLPADLTAWPLGYKRPWPAKRFKKKDEQVPAPVPTAPS